MSHSHILILITLTTTLNVYSNRLWAPPYTTNINFELNQPPDLTWPDQPTLTNRQLTQFEQHWPPDIWHLTPDNWFTTWERTICTSSWKFQPQITMPGNSELVTKFFNLCLLSRLFCYRTIVVIFSYLYDSEFFLFLLSFIDNDYVGFIYV